MLDSFLRDYALPDSLKDIVKSYPARSGDYMAGSMLTSIKESVSRNFQGRLEEHVSSLLERVWWKEHQKHKQFEDVINKGGRIICAHLRQYDPFKADELLEHFLKCRRGPNSSEALGESWRHGLFQVASELQELTKDMRVMTVRPLKKAKRNGCEAFNYSLKSRFNVMLRILRDIREGIGQPDERLTSA